MLPKKQGPYISRQMLLGISICFLVGIHMFSRDKPTDLSGKITSLYNSGTVLALQSVQSGDRIDTATLQQAEQYLSGAADLAYPPHPEILHNLETVRRLLQKQQKELSQQQPSPTGSGYQQQSGSGQENKSQQASTSSSSTEKQQSSSSLSPQTKQQLEQYQQQLASEQAQNQQFFNKQTTPQGGDPFALLEQFLGEQPSLDQQIGGSGQKDW